MSTEGPTPPRTTLARRYARLVAGICVLLLLSAGAIEGIFSYRQARTQMADRQRVQALAAAREIDQYLQAALQALRQVQALPWGSPGFDTMNRRRELQRLLALNPAIVWVRDVAADGGEALFVSRIEPDRVHGASVVEPPGAISAPGIVSGGFDQQGVPNALLSLPLTAPGEAGVRTDAMLNLRFLDDLVSGLRPDNEGRIFVVDAAGTLLAHPEPSLVLSQRSVADHPAVAQARRAMAGKVPRVPLMAADGPGLQGDSAITTAAPLVSADWLVFVEEPRVLAMRPAAATIERSLLLLAAGGCLAVLVSVASARRMAAPIAQLRRATERLASGDLGVRLDVRRDDEIGGLARDFNDMSAQLQHSYAVLEQRVDERTAQLLEQQAQAEAKRREAERANALKTRFLANASHDLRQPLHAIGLLTGVLRMRLQDHGALELSQQIEQGVRHMDDMFVALLHISNLDAGKVTPRPIVLDLQTVLDRARDVYAPIAANQHLRFRCRPVRALVRADPALLDQALGNLCVNAVRYTRRGGVLVGCRRRSAGIVLQVWDTGIGIAADQTEAIFDEFVRLRTEHHVEGLGLGLSIVHRNADLLGMEVGVRSRPGRGSCFELRIPPGLLAAPDEAPPVAGLRPDLLPISGAFVLVVEDDPVLRQATVMLLRQHGALVVDAGSPASALAVALDHPRSPDLIVSDLHFEAQGPAGNEMREDGWWLVRQLRSQAGRPLPALFVTADASAVATPGEGVAVLHKPVLPSDLLESVSASLASPDALLR